MRTKFTLGIKVGPTGTFPTNDQLCEWLRSFGWEPKEAADITDKNERIKAYRQLAASMFKEMPEVAQEEKDDLIFASWFSSEQAGFLVTRSSEGELTFRFLHEDLSSLFAGTNRVIRAIHDQVYKKNLLSRFRRLWRWRRHSTIPDAYNNIYFIPSNKALLYERSSEHVIMRGRIIRSFLGEALLQNKKDALVTGGVVLLILLFSIAKVAEAGDIVSSQEVDSVTVLAHSIAGGILYWFSQALGAITIAFLVGISGLIISWWQIKRSTIIAWEPVSN
jgi:hypothetical protein